MGVHRCARMGVHRPSRVGRVGIDSGSGVSIYTATTVGAVPIDGSSGMDLSCYTPSSWIRCAVAGKECRIGAGVPSRPPIQPSSVRRISILTMHMIEHISVVIGLGNHMGGVTGGLREYMGAWLGHYVSGMARWLGEYMAVGLRNYMVGVT